VEPVWFFVSFRRGQHAFGNVLIGSAVISALCALPLVLAFASTRTPSARQVSILTFAYSIVVRLPIYILLSAGLIKVALRMSRSTARAFGKLGESHRRTVTRD
jgi:hypothetical protein